MHNWPWFFRRRIIVISPSVISINHGLHLRPLRWYLWSADVNSMGKIMQHFVGSFIIIVTYYITQWCYASYRPLARGVEVNKMRGFMMI
ncbi:hypothetical protein F5884DRAFT_799232 [Xylogone sp. PMI_703]|nr:hypothetical protein F5884DRAFT_799232 [Xylogone sp. PMI_703]